MKKLFVVCVALLLLLSLVACSASDERRSERDDAEETQETENAVLQAYEACVEEGKQPDMGLVLQTALENIELTGDGEEQSRVLQKEVLRLLEAGEFETTELSLEESLARHFAQTMDYPDEIVETPWGAIGP